MNEILKGLLEFIKNSPTAFQAVDSISEILDKDGFERLYEHSVWNLEKGGKYYVTRNSSSIISFILPEGEPVGFSIVASHSDSPTFKLKDNFELDAPGKYIKFDTEKYGGMIMSSWFDRPLSVAGRVAVKDGNSVRSQNVTIDKDTLIIPNVAIHMNRSVNDGYKYNPQSDTLPLFGSSESKGSLKKMIASSLSTEPENILSHDLYLYCRTEGTVFGTNDEFVSAPRIDNLECAYTTLSGFLSSEKSNMIKVYAVFDNEETGSMSKQGADSTFLSDMAERITGSYKYDREKLNSLLASSVMMSSDNAHARHPNHPEFADSLNCPDMNKGIVLKFNASQRYTTDAISGSIVKFICDKAGVPCQEYANRSDIAGGSTLGAISNTHVSVCTADIGLAQLAMHSSYETAGSLDAEYMVRFAKEFYSSDFKATGSGFTIE